ncbi:hypothetical protein TNCV_194531 [Trichonephila clavipes]|nr:hypothetical protein TNCV_194531 [Trichonephila clavipes]
MSSSYRLLGGEMCATLDFSGTGGIEKSILSEVQRIFREGRVMSKTDYAPKKGQWNSEPKTVCRLNHSKLNNFNVRFIGIAMQCSREVCGLFLS